MAAAAAAEEEEEALVLSVDLSKERSIVAAAAAASRRKKGGRTHARSTDSQLPEARSGSKPSNLSVRAVRSRSFSCDGARTRGDFLH